MKTDWLAIAQDIAECARAKAAHDQGKLEMILKRSEKNPAAHVAALSR